MPDLSAGKLVFQPCLNCRQESGSTPVGWADLHPDLLAEVFSRLYDIVDYVRCLSVYASWRSVPEKTMNISEPKKGGQPPWLLISSTNDEPGSRSFYAPSHFYTNMYTIHLPQIAHRSCLGSSQGFLITIDGSKKLCALNPLTGARFPLPPTTTHPDILIYRRSRPDARPRLIIPDECSAMTIGNHKAVISPSLDTIAVSAEGFARYMGKKRHFVNIAIARVGDDSWTPLVPPCPLTRQYFSNDFIFHQGRIYALFNNGYLIAFDLENPPAPPLVSPMTPEIATSCCAFLSESPDGQDLLLLMIYLTISELINMGVSRLDKNTLEWNRVQSIGDVALFLDGKYLSALSTREFPCIKSNCIYFTNLGWIDHNAHQIRVYDLDDGSINPLSPDDELGELLPPLVWFTPAL